MDINNNLFNNLGDLCYVLENFDAKKPSQTIPKIGNICNAIIELKENEELDKYQKKNLNIIIKLLKKLYGLISVMIEFTDELGEIKHYKTIKNLGREINELR